MERLMELLESRAEKVERMDSILSKADEEKRDLSEDEEKEYDQLEKDLEKLEVRILREEKLAREKESMNKTYTPGQPEGRSREKASITFKKTEEDGTGGFRNFGEYVHTLVTNPRDNRLDEFRVHQVKNGTSGGFAVPTQFMSELFQVAPADAVIRPRSRVISAGDPPDAEMTLPALNQGTGQNMYGGIIMYNQGESDQITESTANLRQVTFKPRKITGYMTASNELLNNWGAASSILPGLMRTAMNGKEDTDFLTGDGVNKSLGVLNLPCAVDYNRATASQIAWADIYGMYARLKTGGMPVWIASQTTIPQLVQIADASSANLWVQSAGPGLPPSLMGIPVLFHDRSPGLGSKGDLVLADLSYYWIKDGSGPMIATSEHFRFQNDEVAFRITWHVDGQSPLDQAIPLEGSTANTVSPFVILDTP